MLYIYVNFLCILTIYSLSISFSLVFSIEQTTEIVKTALELGINHFDVAESHAGKFLYVVYVVILGN